MQTLVDKIIEHLREGGVVQITTYTKSWIYDGAKCIPLFKNGKDGEPLVREGKRFVSFKGNGVRFGRYVDKTNPSD